MNISQACADGLYDRIDEADSLYGDFQSTHEALGVAVEEWQELGDEIRANDPEKIKRECLDLAAVLIRLHDQIDSSQRLKARSFAKAVKRVAPRG